MYWFDLSLQSVLRTPHNSCRDTYRSNDLSVDYVVANHRALFIFHL